MRPSLPRPLALLSLLVAAVSLASCTRQAIRSTDYTLYLLEQQLTQTVVAGTAIAQGTPLTALPQPTSFSESFWQQLATHTIAVQTAVAQGTPIAFLSTPTPAPTETPRPTPTQFRIPSPPTDWYTNPITGPVLNSLKALGGEDLVKAAVIALASILGTILLFTFKSIARGITQFFSGLWEFSRRLNKDYVFERAYLSWLIGQYRHLGMLPAQIAARRWQDRQQFVDLERIYTRLSLNNQSDDEPWLTESNSAGRWSKALDPVTRTLKNAYRVALLASVSLQNILSKIKITLAPTLNIEHELNKSFPEPMFKPGSLSLIIDRTPRLVIRGDPGSGKTTLMRYLAVTCARALRNDRAEGDAPYLVSQRLDWQTKPFPIFVRLSRHGDVINWGDTRSLLNAISDEMPVDLRRRCPVGFFDRLLSRHPCLLLLDAFDELGSPQARSDMAEHINGFLQIYGQEKHRFVVTTRIIGYEGQLDSYGFQSRTVQPLQEGDRSNLIYLRYYAYIRVEILGRSPEEARGIDEALTRRADELVKSVEALPRLTQLATNPMLLSLITLVHFLKVELPDERVLLYRDCVEILTERWQRQKRIETGWKGQTTQDLTLTQKIVVLQELAFAMQQRRDPANSQALLPKKTAITVIARALSQLLGDSSSANSLTYRAEEWVNGIQTDSGILLEQGLSSDGEPLIGFSHLTFQEYLAAIAINENAAYLVDLNNQLLNPTWREVIRLYVVLADDASPIIRRLADNDHQPAGLLLAGWCLTERVRKVDAKLPAQVNQRLMRLFADPDAELDEVSQIFEASLDPQAVAPFLHDQVLNPSPRHQVAAIHALRGIAQSTPALQNTRELLVSLIDSDRPLETRIAAQEALSILGDPRFDQIEPILLPVRAHTLAEADFDILQYSPALKRILDQFESKPVLRWLAFLIRPLFAGWTYISLVFEAYNKDMITPTNIRLFLKKYYLFWRRFMLKSPNYVDAFEIARYPVTNLQYSTFVTETQHQPPPWWPWGVCPKDQASHPVEGVTYFDAVKYCRWLSQKTGHHYRLPTEWEWETAAGVLAGRPYPWGQEFDANLCNCRDSQIRDTTPVGIYLDVKSPFGLQDTSGNVWEIIRPIRWPLFTVAVIVSFALLLVLVILTRSLNLSFILNSFPWLLIFWLLVLPGGLETLGTVFGLAITCKGGCYRGFPADLKSTSRDVLLSVINFVPQKTNWYIFGLRVVRYPQRKP